MVLFLDAKGSQNRLILVRSIMVLRVTQSFLLVFVLYHSMWEAEKGVVTSSILKQTHNRNNVIKMVHMYSTEKCHLLCDHIPLSTVPYNLLST